MASSLIAAKVASVAVLLVSASEAAHAADGAASSTLRALNADLLTHDSATEVLGRWCASHHLADPPIIRALRDKAVVKLPDRKTRTLLQLGASEPVRYRRVRLVCGSHTLSKADNWYVPNRLTPDMNSQLDQTDIPFGLVVKPLGYRRVRLTVTLLLGREGTPQAERGVLRHEALLVTASGLPFSFVAETYTSDVTIISPPGR